MSEPVNESTILVWNTGAEPLRQADPAVLKSSEIPRRGIDYITEVRLGPRVEAIGSRCFSYCDRLTRVLLPEGLKTIGTAAFFCSGLTEVDLPGSLERIGDEAFLSCRHLRHVTVRSPHTRIGWQAFSNVSPEAVMILPKGSRAECFAIESGIRYFYDDGSVPVVPEVRVSGDGDLLENCWLCRVYDFCCRADSDGGIDDRSTSVDRYRIPAQTAVWENERLIGFRLKEHLFRFDDRKTHTLRRVLKDGWVGGWGNVEETEEYRLFLGPPPEEAGPMPL